MTTKRDKLRERIDRMLSWRYGDKSGLTTDDIMAAHDRFVSEVIGTDPRGSSHFADIIRGEHLVQRHRAGLAVKDKKI